MARSDRPVRPTTRQDHRRLLGIPDVRRWHDRQKLRSELSADVDLRKLGLFLHRTGLRPQQLVALARDQPSQLEDLLVRFATALRKEGRLETYIVKLFGGVRGWLAFNHVRFEGFPKLRPVVGESIRSERVPTQDELRRVLPMLTTRGRVSALLMAQGGIRPGVLGDYRGGNGLTLGDFPELCLEPELRFDPPPGRRSIMLRVPARLSKTSQEYVTFATMEAADAILAFLTERRDRGETLSPGSPLVSMTPLGTRAPHAKGAGSFVTTKSVELELRRALKAACPPDTRWRPYVLRAFCSSAMVAARVDRDAREAMLGHSLGVSGRYNLAKRLPPKLLEMLRDEYERALDELLIERRPDRPSVERLERGLWSAVLESVGFPPAEAAALAEGGEGSVRDAIRSRLGNRPSPENQGEAGPVSPGTFGFGSLAGRRLQRVVGLDELDAWLARGAEYIAPAGPDRAIVRTS